MGEKRTQWHYRIDAGCYWYVLLKLGADVNAVYTYLIANCRQKDHCWPAVPTIAADLGMGDKTVKRCLKVLQDNGFITTEEQYYDDGNRRPNRHTIRELHDEQFRTDHLDWARKDGRQELRETTERKKRPGTHLLSDGTPRTESWTGKDGVRRKRSPEDGQWVAVPEPPGAD